MRARRMSVAVIAMAGLVLAGCANSIEGSPVAAVAPVPASDGAAPSSPQSDGSSDGAGLPEPGDLADGGIPDLGELLGGAEGMPDLGELLGGAEGVPDLGELLGGVEGMPGADDLAGMLGELQNSGQGEFAGLFDSACLQGASISMAVGMLLLKPMTGQALTQSDIDSAFQAAEGMPAELQAELAKLKAAAEAAVGRPAAEVMELLNSPEITEGMDSISAYLDAHCGQQ